MARIDWRVKLQRKVVTMQGGGFEIDGWYAQELVKVWLAPDTVRAIGDGDAILARLAELERIASKKFEIGDVEDVGQVPTGRPVYKLVTIDAGDLDG